MRYRTPSRHKTWCRSNNNLVVYSQMPSWDSHPRKLPSRPSHQKWVSSPLCESRPSEEDPWWQGTTVSFSLTAGIWIIQLNHTKSEDNLLSLKDGLICLKDVCMKVLINIWESYVRFYFLKNIRAWEKIRIIKAVGTLRSTLLYPPPPAPAMMLEKDIKPI